MNKKQIGHVVSTHLENIYGETTAQRYVGAFTSLVETYLQILAQQTKREGSPLECHSSILITYADSIFKDGKEATLCTLQSFLHEYVGSTISTVHLLPFFPASSDDGFSVIDPTTVDPVFGSWDDIHNLQSEYSLMFDFVVNHLSQENKWIQAALGDDERYKDFIITMTGKEDLHQVFRPRALPLLTRFGEKLVWTTFSSDQVDVNYQNPEVLLKMSEVLLQYLAHGASVIRLDAVAFLWKELGTRCIHHPKTHAIIQFFSQVISLLSPSSILITETNVPHQENISYFGDGHNEATMVYNFSLPPLVYHTFLSQDATALRTWAGTLSLPSTEVTFFNFLASHDGIGLMPVKDILRADEIEAMAKHAEAEGGFVSSKSESDGSTSPYELNINYFSALSHIVPGESEELAVERFIAASAIMIFFKGIPGIYIHSLIGSKNYCDAPSLATHPRKINREKIQIATLRKELSNPKSRRARILNQMLALLDIRRKERALSPLAAQMVLETGNPHCFVFSRSMQDDNAESEELLIAVNISASTQEVSLDWKDGMYRDLVGQSSFHLTSPLLLHPYQVLVVKAM